MSHFTKLGVSFKQQNEQDLIASLKARFGENSVEVSDSGLNVSDYYGNRENNVAKCNIVVRASNLGKGGKADIGFERTKDGGYVLHTDQMYFNATDVGKLTQEYGYKVAERRMKAQGYMVKREPGKNGALKLVASKYV